jgi:Protease inhibitor Inh
MALALTGCSGDRLSSGEATPAMPDMSSLNMAGRWLLSAPNAPSCGMNFGAAPHALTGAIQPEGGCPGNFFMSRHWELAPNGLIIKDYKDNPLAQLKFAAGHFTGQATDGTPVTLSR